MIHVDTSVPGAIFFREPGAAELVARLERQRSERLMISAWTLTEMAGLGEDKQESVADRLYDEHLEQPKRKDRTMVTKFADLRARMSPESRAWAEARALAMLAEMPPNELRQARGLSQKVLAEVPHIQQPAITKLERRTDMHISTLRSHIEAMGGELEVAARFPDGSVKISNFPELEKAVAP